jgi:DNA-binding response OmpR family regulator
LGKRVLICDDEPHIVESLSYLVKREGYDAVIATDGEEGLRKAREDRPDLILLDIMMPKLSGFDVCEKLKRDEKTKDIYIIILTARGEEADEFKGRELGADEFITKPFSPRQVRGRLHEILDAKPKDSGEQG